MSRSTIYDKTSQVTSGLKIFIFKAGKLCAREFTWSHNANVNAKFCWHSEAFEVKYLLQVTWHGIVEITVVSQQHAW